MPAAHVKNAADASMEAACDIPAAAEINYQRDAKLQIKI
jgi:hypothetical protein